MKNESGWDFQQGQIWNDRSQKQKKRITAATQYQPEWTGMTKIVLFCLWLLANFSRNPAEFQRNAQPSRSAGGDTTSFW